jgi:hypothetical protein
MKYLLIIIVIFILTGCGHMPKHVWDKAEEMCSVNDGVIKVVELMGSWKAHCENGATFKIVVGDYKE